ncbi:MAG: hypothetical protein LBI40_01100 [Treponema sp.]|nr:hypothetical protein [Treponema sp.]
MKGGPAEPVKSAEPVSQATLVVRTQRALFLTDGRTLKQALPASALLRCVFVLRGGGAVSRTYEADAQLVCRAPLKPAPPR